MMSEEAQVEMICDGRTHPSGFPRMTPRSVVPVATVTKASLPSSAMPTTTGHRAGARRRLGAARLATTEEEARPEEDQGVCARHARRRRPDRCVRRFGTAVCAARAARDAGDLRRIPPRQADNQADTINADLPVFLSS